MSDRRLTSEVDVLRARGDATAYGLNGETVVRSFDSGASGQNTENRDNHKTQNNS